MASASIIRIVRGSDYADKLRKYKIFANDTEVGSIARNSTLQFEVPAGPAKIEARIDWARSKPLTVNATPGRVIEVEVANYWGAFLAIWAITFGRSKYLSLREISVPSVASNAPVTRSAGPPSIDS